MRRYIQIISLLVIFYSKCYSQQNAVQPISKLEYEEIGFEVKDSQFKEFLDLFYHIPFPLNYNLGYKKASRVFPSWTKERKFSKPNKMLGNILNLKIEDWFYTYYDVDDGMEVKVNKTWYIREAFVISKNLVGCILTNTYYTTDPIIGQSFMYTFNPNGEICDSKILSGSINQHGIYDSFVLLDSKHFKTFRYTIHEPNIKHASYAFEDFYVEYKDIEGYRAECVISDYEITDEGKIKLVEVSKPILLKQDAWKYTDSGLPAFDDDSMNRDWNKYLSERKY
ncbi:hypothetical protein LCL86_12950 [Muricauda ruestringensis]|jgi:hypothetical protein|uniref:hypothetical protein n=1 Tax=Flagellimonas ruestringensis TaxID=111501 RepID=UPI001CD25859|nr:hypothetical protein [Allomuricauda ruestringensis]MCA0959960.1 hypothetical protein [Allomuricauda ruestringensis]